MALSINWATRVITVPQADLTLITGTLYELDTDAFRLELKAIEASSDGMSFEDTHIHNTEVTVAGTTFARTIEIINGYSVEFEDGQYSVRLVNSNNNIFDVENGILVQNQVQVIPNNSAGLIKSSGLTPSESTTLQRLLVLSEADEERVGAIWRKLNKDDSGVELEKEFDGDVDGDWTLTEIP